MEECILFIDGAYLSLVSKFIGNGKPLKFDIKKFAENLAKKESLSYKEIFYYNCPPFQSEPPTIEQEKRKAGYDKFIIKLKTSRIQVREGRCQMIDRKFTQKGVDVLLTIDMIRNAIKSNIKKFIIIACDTDFVPAINNIRKEDKIRVILYYFRSNHPMFSMSDHILSVCDKIVRLTKEDFEKASF